MPTRDQRGLVDLIPLVLSRAAKTDATRLIGIDGHGGSGKTTLASRLAQTLPAQTIQTDDFASWDNPKNWWPRVIEDVLAPIARGATTLSYGRSQWWEGHQRESIWNQPVTPIMILEGVGSLRREFRPYVCFGIYVTTPRDVCLQRGVARDAAFGTPEEMRDLWQRYFSDEEKYMARDLPEQYADIVVEGSRPFDDQLALCAAPLPDR